MRYPRYVGTLAALFLLWWIACAIGPHDRAAWLLENALSALAVVILVVTARAFPLSRISYTLIFVFLCLHTLGAHYTYSLVPYGDWFRWIDTGERNHYDRFVHFAYGLLIAYPIRELFLRVAGVRGFWGYFLPLDLTMSTSMLYELIEWGAAVIFGGALGAAYLGAQGDPWDAHKDMALASLGALLAMSLTAGINAWLRRDFAREWVESLRVKIAEPLGEQAIEDLLRQPRR